ncbi:DUF72 domain-containing protein [Mucilaginibacter agri]|uniref:DUF72 domain-containing protein n=1 Tax=Mucilaginibacter agri TaxID=2695265 RepID=A0A965ZHI3_9SPHI|nr:DUF72 domain-containing protein [Mucilaginibacter agri]NCD70079.1 DUF72 domain-containing protein [Mucilaginibacter agri]
MLQWYIGCSGFSYKSWAGKFYPADLPQRKWFEFYCQHFNTLELNVTFYRFPQLKTLQNWYNTSPADFRFSVKAPRTITHYKLFTDTTELITEFYDVIDKGLKEKLGPVLFQLPPRFAYSEEHLERITSNLNPSFKNVVELRNPSWWRDDVYETFAKYNITFVGQSHPKLPDDLIQNTPMVYYRFHGVPELYKSSYSTKFLKTIVDGIKQNNHTKEAWLYFNNDIDMAAIENVREVQELIK